tara:strand:- start:1347 stop:1628 length:282 start_codon:yes stop_codon:yes gene_type:complete
MNTVSKSNPTGSWLYIVVNAPEYYARFAERAREGKVLSVHKTIKAAKKAAESHKYFSYNTGWFIYPAVVADNSAGLRRGDTFTASNAPKTLTG